MNMMLLCMDCLDLTNSFTYDKIKLFRFVKFYPNEFLRIELTALEYQIFEIMRVSELAKKLVSLKKYRIYPLVYLLMKLTLLLPIATATVESIFYNQNHQDSTMQSIER